jgi:ATP-dependent RNA helicase UAP56/SUB2
VSSEADEKVIKDIEERFQAAVPAYPEAGVDSSTYMAS